MDNKATVDNTSIQEIIEFEGNKNLKNKNSKIEDKNSIIFWIKNYFEKIVSGGKETTIKAKKNDLQKFLFFYYKEIGSYHIDYWTPSITKAFQKAFQKENSKRTGKPYKATTINRVFASLKHCSRWIHERKPFIAGDPFEGIKDLMQDEPDWNGLTDRQLALCRGAIDQRMKICIKKNQNPLLEAAVFYILLYTGLREFELCSLTLEQYYDKKFHEVKRKGFMINKYVFLPSEAKAKLDKYLEVRQKIKVANNSLLINRYGNSINEKNVFRICERISNQACVNLKKEDKFILRPHQLRHSFLKRANDKFGLSYAKKVSGNIGFREIYRYTAPNQEEIEEKAEELFK